MSIFSNQDFALRCETTINKNRIEFVQTAKKLNPESDVSFLKIGSGYAIFAGKDSPLSHACGLGFDSPVSKSQLDELERFYFSRNCPIIIEVSQLSDISLSQLLIDNNYSISDYTFMLAKRLSSQERFSASNISNIKKVSESKINIYARTTTQGFLGLVDNSKNSIYSDEKILSSYDEVSNIFFHQPNSECFLSYLNNMPVGSGGLFFNQGMSLFVGTCTLAQFRLLGVHTDLIKSRLDFSVSKGMEFAISVTFPGGVSQHNLEKLGFQIMYGRVTLSKQI